MWGCTPFCITAAAWHSHGRSRGCASGGHASGDGKRGDRTAPMGRPCWAVHGDPGLQREPALPCSSTATGLTDSGVPGMLWEARLGRGANPAMGWGARRRSPAAGWPPQEATSHPCSPTEPADKALRSGGSGGLLLPAVLHIRVRARRQPGCHLPDPLLEERNRERALPAGAGCGAGRGDTADGECI